MKIVEILCNPRPGSYNLALAASAAEKMQSLGHEVLVHDLYKEGFDPVMEPSELARSYSLDGLVQVHCNDLAAADGLVVFHPEWWGQPPAVLKGWIDRVFRQGVAYDLEGEEFSEKGWKPLLTGKKGLVFITSDAEAQAARTLEALVGPLRAGAMRDEGLLPRAAGDEAHGSRRAPGVAGVRPGNHR